MEHIGIDLAKGKDKTVEALYSKGEFFKICSDRDSECKDVKNKSVCWMHAPSKGICPYLNKE